MFLLGSFQLLLGMPKFAINRQPQPNSGEIYRKVGRADCGIFFKYAPDKKGSYKLLSYNCLSIEGLYLHVIMSGGVTCNYV